jgi:hypothetical protein
VVFEDIAHDLLEYALEPQELIDSHVKSCKEKLAYSREISVD